MFQKCQGFRFIIDNKVYDPRYEKNFLIREIVQFLIEWQGYVPRYNESSDQNGSKSLQFKIQHSL